MKDAKKAIRSLEDLLQAGVSPYHAIKKSVERLSAQGFEELKAHKAWEIKPGKSYYVNLYGSSLLAFTVGGNVTTGGTAAKVCTPASLSHSPCLRVTPKPELA